jgi:hypothetical protein
MQLIIHVIATFLSSFDLGKIKEFISPEQMTQFTRHMQDFINSLGW